MSIERITLTPEIAATLLANRHPRQRRTSMQKSDAYAAAIEAGRWPLVPDALLLVGPTHADERNPLGSMFNGAHRCVAVVKTGKSIEVYIDRDADPSIFDVIDTGNTRTAYQFVNDTFASQRSAAARLILWYERRFDRQPSGHNIVFDLHDVIGEVEDRAPVFDSVMADARQTYEYTGISFGVALAAYSIAFELGYGSQVRTFVDGVVNPSGLPAGSPARLLSDRFRRQSNRTRRRSLSDDWTILVRALNLHIQGRTSSRLVLGGVWPKVGESEADFTRRRTGSDAAKRSTERVA